MTPPEDPDPRSRRWSGLDRVLTIVVLVLLALAVAGFVFVNTVCNDDVGFSCGG